MINRLPHYYRKSTVVKNVYNAINSAFSELSAKIDTAEKDLFIVTAQNFGRHEKDVGLTGTVADSEVRRQRVISRLRGNGMLTVEALKALVVSYEPTGCVITEDFLNSTVTIFFNGIHGRPNNFDEIEAAVKEVIPAHIAVEYKFINNTWGDIRNFTWEDLSKKTWEDVLNKEAETWNS